MVLDLGGVGFWFGVRGGRTVIGGETEGSKKWPITGVFSVSKVVIAPKAVCSAGFG